MNTSENTSKLDIKSISRHTIISNDDWNKLPLHLRYKINDLKRKSPYVTGVNKRDHELFKDDNMFRFDAPHNNTQINVKLPFPKLKMFSEKVLSCCHNQHFYIPRTFKIFEARRVQETCILRNKLSPQLVHENLFSVLFVGEKIEIQQIVEEAKENEVSKKILRETDINVESSVSKGKSEMRVSRLNAENDSNKENESVVNTENKLNVEGNSDKNQSVTKSSIYPLITNTVENVNHASIQHIQPMSVSKNIQSLPIQATNFQALPIQHIQPIHNTNMQSNSLIQPNPIPITNPLTNAVQIQNTNMQSNSFMQPNPIQTINPFTAGIQYGNTTNFNNTLNNPLNNNINNPLNNTINNPLKNPLSNTINNNINNPLNNNINNPLNNTINNPLNNPLSNTINNNINNPLNSTLQSNPFNNGNNYFNPNPIQNNHFANQQFGKPPSGIYQNNQVNDKNCEMDVIECKVV
jgi:hypothetical protein